MQFVDALKPMVSRLPKGWQNELRRLRFGRQIRKGRFFTDEIEFEMLSEWVSPGDCVIDVGANIGHYTSRLSKLVGPKGRVFAFEPIPETFEILAANAVQFEVPNVTLINMAAAETTKIVGMAIPKFQTGLDNFYMANVTTAPGDVDVTAISIDNLKIQNRVTFVKIDAEGYEVNVLKGMQKTIEADLPTMVIEDNSPDIAMYLTNFGYVSRAMKNSSNRIFQPAAKE